MWQIMVAIATIVSVRWGPCTVVSALAGLRSYHDDHAEILREARAKNLSRSTDSGAKAPPSGSVPWKRLWQEFRGQDVHNHVFIMTVTLISVALNLIGFLTPNYTGKILDVLTTSDASMDDVWPLLLIRLELDLLAWLGNVLVGIFFAMTR